MQGKLICIHLVQVIAGLLYSIWWVACFLGCGIHIQVTAGLLHSIRWGALLLGIWSFAYKLRLVFCIIIAFGGVACFLGCGL